MIKDFRHIEWCRLAGLGELSSYYRQRCPEMSALTEKPLHTEFMLTQALSGGIRETSSHGANRPGS
jgi:hypothetical protein